MNTLIKNLTIDDFSQYAPSVAVFGLDIIGIKGKNTFKNKAVILSYSVSYYGIDR